MNTDNTMILVAVITWTIIYGTICLSHLNKDNFLIVVLFSSLIYMGGLWVATEVRENLYDTVDWCVPYYEEGEENEGWENEEEDLFPRTEINKVT